jgi:DNA anti-recombination protein RmuC
MDYNQQSLLISSVLLTILNKFVAFDDRLRQIGSDFAETKKNYNFRFEELKITMLVKEKWNHQQRCV